MIEIDIYSKYFVIVENEYSFVDDETSTPSDWNFKCNITKYDFKADCKELLEYLYKLINDEYFSDLIIKENKIIINIFNPITGEGDHISIILVRLKDEKGFI